jgi:hypothetical protein
MRLPLTLVIYANQSANFNNVYKCKCNNNFLLLTLEKNKNLFFF